MNYPYHYKNGRLFCEEVDIAEAAENMETPFYLYSSREIRHSCQIIREAGSPYHFKPFYALKANYNPALLKLIREEGFGADIVSGGELYFARRAGFVPEEIVFAGVGKTEQELRAALKEEIASINIESEAELLLLSRIAANLKQKTAIAIRINPDIDAQTHEYISTGLHSNKFGVDAESAMQLYRMAAADPWLEPEGIHMHIGSQIENGQPYVDAARFLLNFIERLAAEGIRISTVDLGGGIGINYEDPFEKPEKARTFTQHILNDYLAVFKNRSLKLFLEVGRSVVGSAGVLISRVIYTKTTPAKHFTIVDAAMNNLIRPSLYRAHHPIAAVRKETTAPVVTTDVVGPVCETGDFLARERALPALKEGDLIAVGGAGAYGQSLASLYNLRPMVAEYLVDGSSIRKISPALTPEELADRFEW
ncbi:MAG: diaminopimelate decarboxylase [Calditrichaeota bacterium]|nr:MAG: diaminopimelate decarboxylase [Calditrichota bacterium]